MMEEDVFTRISNEEVMTFSSFRPEVSPGRTSTPKMWMPPVDPSDLQSVLLVDVKGLKLQLKHPLNN